ncbi:MAG: S8 family serine peptidase [Chitinivibrionales bacterium]|nr:S8 family serine peptidase [Chitinivibrionales bacterium]
MEKLIFKQYFFLKAINEAQSHRTVLIGAAGNDGEENAPFYPAAYDGVISVAAVDRNDDRSVWNSEESSNFGDWIDISAPGTNLRAADLGLGHRGFNGTSAAAPVVTGAASILWSYYPKTSPEGIEYILKESSAELNSTGLGAGRIDIFEALFNGSFEVHSKPDIVPFHQIAEPGQPIGGVAIVKIGHYWILEGPNTAIIPSLGPYGPNPRNGHSGEMAFLFVDFDIPEARISQSFNVPSIDEFENERFNISFDYDVFIKDGGPDEAHLLQAILEFPAGAELHNLLLSKQEWVIDEDQPISFSDRPNFILRHTGWRTFSFFVSRNLVGIPGEFRFSIVLQHRLSPGEPAALLIDNIRFTDN